MEANQAINQPTQNKSYMAGNHCSEPLFFPCITKKMSVHNKLWQAEY